MTKSELKQLFNEASKEISSELTPDKIKSTYFERKSEMSHDEFVIQATHFSVDYSKKLLYKVLEKILCKD